MDFLGKLDFKGARNHLTKYHGREEQLTNYEVLLINYVHFQTRKLFFMNATFSNLTPDEMYGKYSLWKNQVEKIVNILETKKNLEEKLERKDGISFLLRRKLHRVNMSLFQIHS